MTRGKVVTWVRAADGRKNCRSLGCARDDKIEGSDSGEEPLDGMEKVS
jgi:hypothetical protein